MQESTNPNFGGRTGGRGHNGGGRGETASASATASASVATSRRKCKHTSTVWDHFDIIEEINNEGDTIHGTTHLRRHSEKCLQKLSQSGGPELRQIQLSFDRATGGLTT
ncbi:hypothetical protein L484_024745 [Morus notabilis]|uniref:Uncharacterized protein n=1 Tax=Morus notabilis TaxID=981085 RepID=W9RD08_9ROSA|nr:hypothetical protein L484_024745 [Morus notabilis]